MRTIDTSTVEEAVYRAALRAGGSLTASCRSALDKAYAAEDEGAAKFALGKLIENSNIAREKVMPVCQDTGMACVFVELGQDVHIEGNFEEAIHQGVRKGYGEGYLRKSIVGDPLRRVNTEDNPPAAITVRLVPGDGCKVTVAPKGFGSENMSALYMLKPAQGVEGIINAIVETVKKAGSRPCPPVYVGVGIGGTFDGCAYLAKKALTRDIGTHSDREDIAAIEDEALRRINALNIGCQGFHGKTTALGVSCEWAPTHIAGLPVAVNIQCHCVRCVKELL